MYAAVSLERSPRGTSTLNQRQQEDRVFTEEQQKLWRYSEQNQYPKAREQQALEENAMRVWYKNQQAKLSSFANSKSPRQLQGVQGSQPIHLSLASTPVALPGPVVPAFCSPGASPLPPAPVGPANLERSWPHRAPAPGPTPRGPEISVHPATPAPAYTVDPSNLGLYPEHLPFFHECMNLLERFISDVFSSSDKNPQIAAQLASIIQEAKILAFEDRLSLGALGAPLSRNPSFGPSPCGHHLLSWPRGPQPPSAQPHGRLHRGAWALNLRPSDGGPFTGHP